MRHSLTSVVDGGSTEIYRPTTTRTTAATNPSFSLLLVPASQPFWDKAGFALGAVTALIGPEAAMACTAAVETEIDDHYSRQLDRLQETGEDPELAAMIEEFREDEREHRDAALAAGAERAPAYPLLSGLIRLGCRAAIRVSERV